MRKTLSRALLIVVTLVVVAIYYLPVGHVDFVENWGEGGFGAINYNRSNVVSRIDHGSPADRAGVRVGDLLVENGYLTTSSLLRAPYAGETEHFTFLRRGHAYSVTLTAVPVAQFTIWQRCAGILAYIPPTVFLVVAFLLVFLRPSIMAWSFYIFAVGYFGTSPAFDYWSHILSPQQFLALGFVLNTVFGPWSVLPLLPFVLRFPNGDVQGWRRHIDPFVWVFLGATFLLYAYEWHVYISTQSLPAWDTVVGSLIPLSAFAFAGLILAKNVVMATPSDRQRWGFLAIGTIASFIAYAIYYVPGVPFAVGQIVGFAVILMPLCIAYAVFRLRVLDVTFVLNRALVYGVLSVGVIAFVSVLDWFFSRVVAIGRFTIGIELLVTIGIGFLLDRINHGVEGVVESIFFRSRRQAEAYLRRAASALPYATDESAISDGLVQVPNDAMDLAAAALYRRSASTGRFEGVATSRQTNVAPASFDPNHLLVRMLLSDERIVWLDEVRSQLDADNAAIYTLAVPVTVRHELVSFTLYGAHANGAQLDPEEAAMLEDLAREASRAYDHVEAVRTRALYSTQIGATVG